VKSPAIVAQHNPAGNVTSPLRRHANLAAIMRRNAQQKLTKPEQKHAHFTDGRALAGCKSVRKPLAPTDSA